MTDGKEETKDTEFEVEELSENEVEDVAGGNCDACGGVANCELSPAP